MISGGLFDLESKEARIAELEEIMSSPDFWDDQKKAQSVIDESNHLKEQVNEFHALSETYEELELAYELIKEEPDEELQKDLEENLKEFTGRLNEFELQLLLSGP